MTGLTDTSWANSEGNSINADDLKTQLETLSQTIRRRTFSKLGVQPGDTVAMHPSMVRHFETALPPDENPLGFSKDVGYLHKFSGIPIFQIAEVEPGVIEFGTHEAFRIKYPEWYKRELEARAMLDKMNLENPRANDGDGVTKL